MAVFEEYLYIDYENVQDVQINIIQKTTKVMIIVGDDQAKVPIELVQKTQPFGDAVEWVRVQGKGRNALDFFIAFFLGRDVTTDSKKTFIIYSKDTGYDPLITHLRKNGIRAKRIVSFLELSQNQTKKVDEAEIRKTTERLRKVPANKRPKKRNSLTAFFAAQLGGTSKQDVDIIIEELFIKKIVYEENGLIKYSLDK